MIGSFTFNWNDFFRPLIYLNAPGTARSRSRLRSSRRSTAAPPSTC